MNQLEHAVRHGRRVVLERRGTEYIVVARGLGLRGGHEAFTGYLPMTGEELVFVLDDIEYFQVLEQ